MVAVPWPGRYAAGVPFARHSGAGRNPVSVSPDGRDPV